jgi:hypothetical protein
MSLFREQIVKRFGRSRGWRKVRKRHIRKFPVCASCGRKKKPEVHHIKDFSTHPELELAADNLITLCRKRCHLLIGHLLSWKSINPEVSADSRWLRLKIEGRR